MKSAETRRSLAACGQTLAEIVQIRSGPEQTWKTWPKSGQTRSKPDRRRAPSKYTWPRFGQRWGEECAGFGLESTKSEGPPRRDHPQQTPRQAALSRQRSNPDRQANQKPPVAASLAQPALRPPSGRVWLLAAKPPDVGMFPSLSTARARSPRVAHRRQICVGLLHWKAVRNLPGVNPKRSSTEQTYQAMMRCIASVSDGTRAAHGGRAARQT